MLACSNVQISAGFYLEEFWGDNVFASSNIHLTIKYFGNKCFQCLLRLMFLAALVLQMFTNISMFMLP